MNALSDPYELRVGVPSVEVFRRLRTDAGLSDKAPEAVALALPNTWHGVVLHHEGVPGGEAWFANSSVGAWLEVLHRYGSRVASSELLSEPDDPEEYLSEEEEEQAFAELNQLAEELKDIDPAAFRGYEGFLWPGLLDRWLY
ncbi:SUKH-4 family immunity protein [Streptomyces bobili]